MIASFLSFSSFSHAILAVEPALRDLATLSRGRVEDVAAVFARIWRLEKVLVTTLHARTWGLG